MSVTIRDESPLGEDLNLLFQRHVEAMHLDTPPESIHMLDRSDLVSPKIRFFVLREDGQPMAMGAWKKLSGPHAEIKSMHVLSEARGRGYATRLLEHLITTARAEGIARMSLETGVQPSFTAARGLYEAAGFTACPPFEGYAPDPNSLFMTRAL